MSIQREMAQGARSDDRQLPLRRRPIKNLAHEVPSHESLDVLMRGAVTSDSASALAGVTEGSGGKIGLQFLIGDQWILEVPMGPRLVEHLRQIVGSLQDQQ